MPKVGLALEKFLFEEVGFNRIQAEYDAENRHDLRRNTVPGSGKQPGNYRYSDLFHTS